MQLLYASCGYRRILTSSTFKKILSEAYIHAYSSTSDETLAEFFDYRKNELNGQQRKWFEQAADQLPDLLVERLRNRKHLTIGHQDANTWNILRPRNPADKVRIIDWEGYHLWFGVVDITAPFVRFQRSELRRAWEIALLQRYHNRLLEYGVKDAEFEINPGTLVLGHGDSWLIREKI